ncbi:hypothetical protein EYF80_016363 [Liparis tanakae]|uniref:Secreted protein n=1 Tax=Liparis tanakae TaxID=230148 RepID=A0A4Z2I5S4_9TELE|nr:hypothetical protein EYF80_016363 [Liparis tanakae]
MAAIGTGCVLCVCSCVSDAESDGASVDRRTRADGQIRSSSQQQHGAKISVLRTYGGHGGLHLNSSSNPQ